jgi:hypothetical protein
VLGIRWSAQYVKIKADPVLAGVVSEIETTGRDCKNYKMSMLPIEFANGWLFTKIKDDAVLSQAVAEMATPTAGGDQKTTVAQMVTMRPDG